MPLYGQTNIWKMRRFTRYLNLLFTRFINVSVILTSNISTRPYILKTFTIAFLTQNLNNHLYLTNKTTRIRKTGISFITFITIICCVKIKKKHSNKKSTRHTLNKQV